MESLEDLGIENHETIDTKLRIKGGKPDPQNYEEIAHLFKENEQEFQDMSRKKSSPEMKHLPLTI